MSERKDQDAPSDAERIEPENPSSGPQSPEPDSKSPTDSTRRDPGAGHTREEGYDEA